MRIDFFKTANKWQKLKLRSVLIYPHQIQSQSQEFYHSDYLFSCLLSVVTGLL